MKPLVPTPRFVLASASPRRRELLRAAGLAFDVLASEVDEEVALHLSPSDAACELARRKAEAVAARLDGEAGRTAATTLRADTIVLGADTIVAMEIGARTRFFGKPETTGDARAMLSSLSGSRHQVVTGVCALRLSDRAARVGYERTWVTMREIEPAEIDAYVASGEWRDKAGGYAIQESADRFVTKLEGGGFDNVVGLPVELALSLASELGVLARGTERG